MPAGVGIGSPVHVRVAIRRQGTNSTRVVKVFAGGGARPAWQSREVGVQQGPRHRLRPSALAKENSGEHGARAIDHAVATVVDAAAWAGEGLLRQTTPGAGTVCRIASLCSSAEARMGSVGTR